MSEQSTQPIPIPPPLHPGETLSHAAVYLTDTHLPGEHLVADEIRIALEHAAVELCGGPGVLATRTQRAATTVLDDYIHRMPAYADADDPIRALVAHVSTGAVIRILRAAALATYPREVER